MKLARTNLISNQSINLSAEPNIQTPTHKNKQFLAWRDIIVKLLTVKIAEYQVQRNVLQYLEE